MNDLSALGQECFRQTIREHCIMPSSINGLRLVDCTDCHADSSGSADSGWELIATVLTVVGAQVWTHEDRSTCLASAINHVYQTLHNYSYNHTHQELAIVVTSASASSTFVTTVHPCSLILQVFEKLKGEGKKMAQVSGGL